jgi:hypothetical protein
MNEQFFVQEVPRSSGVNTLFNVLAYALVFMIFTAISTLATLPEQSARFLTEYQVLPPTEFFVITTIFVLPSLILVGFCLANGVILISARVMGGEGSFGTQAYLQSLYLLPVGTVSLLLRLFYYLPTRGDLVSNIFTFGWSLFVIVLSVRATKAAHNFSTGRAVLGVLVPSLLLFGLLACCLVTIYLLPTG